MLPGWPHRRIVFLFLWIESGTVCQWVNAWMCEWAPESGGTRRGALEGRGLSMAEAPATTERKKRPWTKMDTVVFHIVTNIHGDHPRSDRTAPACGPGSVAAWEWCWMQPVASLHLVCTLVCTWTNYCEVRNPLVIIALVCTSLIINVCVLSNNKQLLLRCRLAPDI